jgi:hypothetical protein
VGITLKVSVVFVSLEVQRSSKKQTNALFFKILIYGFWMMTRKRLRRLFSTPCQSMSSSLSANKIQIIIRTITLNQQKNTSLRFKPIVSIRSFPFLFCGLAGAKTNPGTNHHLPSTTLLVMFELNMPPVGRSYQVHLPISDN